MVNGGQHSQRAWVEESSSGGNQRLVPPQSDLALLPWEVGKRDRHLEVRLAPKRDDGGTRQLLARPCSEFTAQQHLPPALGVGGASSVERVISRGQGLPETPPSQNSMWFLL